MTLGVVLIVGLGEIGWSIGQALAAENLSDNRIGFDFEGDTSKAAREAGIVDHITSKPSQVVSDVDIIFLCLPDGLVETAMEDLAPNLKPSSIVINTAPSKALPREWARKYFDSQEYISATPIGGLGLVEGEENIRSGGDRPFEGGFLAIAADKSTSEATIQIAVTIGQALGASPLFVEADEFDAMMAASHGLPLFLGLALVRHLSDSPGWRDIRKTASADFYHATQPVHEHPFLQAASLHMQRQHLLPRLDSLVKDLTELRALLENGDLETLETEIDRLQRARQGWLNALASGDWETITTPAQPAPRRGFLRSLLGMGPEDQKD